MKNFVSKLAHPFPGNKRMKSNQTALKQIRAAGIVFPNEVIYQLTTTSSLKPHQKPTGVDN